jgi:ribulose kinase
MTSSAVRRPVVIGVDFGTLSGRAVVVVAGGLVKSRFLMRVCAGVTGRPLSLLAWAQGPALGSAMHAAVARVGMR